MAGEDRLVVEKWWERSPREEPGVETFHARSWFSGLRAGLLAGGGLTGLGVGALAAVLAYCARTVVTPPELARKEVLPVLGVGFDTAEPQEGRAPSTVTFPANAETLVPGRYILYFDAGAGCAIIGEILSYSPKLQTVVRSVEKVYSGDLAAAGKVRWSGAIYLNPRDAGCEYEDILMELPVGPAPAWLVRAPEDSTCTT